MDQHSSLPQLPPIAATDTDGSPINQQSHGFTIAIAGTTSDNTTTDPVYDTNQQMPSPNEEQDHHVAPEVQVPVEQQPQELVDEEDDNAIEEEEEDDDVADDEYPEIETAHSEAQARGLPDGWTCSIDVRIVGLRCGWYSFFWYSSIEVTQTSNLFFFDFVTRNI
jgi:hypothetical protein